MKKIIFRVAIVLAVLVVAALAVLFFSINSIVKKGVETAGPMLMKVDVRLGSANISPFSGSGQLTKLFVGNPDGFKTPSSFQLGDVKVGLKPTSVFSDVIVIDEINIQSPEITLEGMPTGNNNLGRILANLKAAGGGGTGGGGQTQTNQAPAAGGPEKKFIVKHFVLDGAKLNLSLNVSLLAGKSTSLEVAPVHLENIGVAENGVTAQQLGVTILEPLLRNVYAAAEKKIEALSKDIQNFTKDTNQINRAIRNVSDLLKKQ